ncbi:MAG: hypothetical protein OK438_00435 [Thaumarchaeota archaeon]|nr:hypothetical protein [Nitrososphaerota archaeon]
MSEDPQTTQTKYVYKLSLPARSERVETVAAVSEADIRAFVSEILGVQNPWQNKKAPGKDRTTIGR